MAELALLGAIAVGIALARINGRLNRLEEVVLRQEPAPAGPAQATSPPAAQRPSTAATGRTSPATAVAPGSSPDDLASGEPSGTWTPPPWPPQTFRPRPAPREPIRLKAFGDRTIEQVVSENLLAIVGGLLVIAGAVFFLGLAISRGWIGETGRVAIAIVVGSLLVAGGLRLGGRMRKVSGTGGRQWAVGSLHGVLCGVGIAVLFLGTVVGTRVYEVLGWAGLPMAVAVGALATAIAVTWQSQDLAGFGIGGALAAPILVDAPARGSTLAFTVVALLASSGVIVAMGWPWLLAIALVTTAPQVAAWIAPVAGHALAGDLGVLAAWNGVILSAAVAAELRQPLGRLRASFASLSFLTATTSSGLGFREL